MSRGLLRLGALLALLLCCAAAGMLVAWWSDTLLAGLLGAVALGLGAMLVLQSMRSARLLAWLRGDAQGAPPELAGRAGELGHQMHKLLRRREQGIEDEQQRLTQFLAAVEASPNGVLLLDANHRITWCSRVAADHLGLDPQRDLAQPVTNLVRAPAFVEHMLHGPAGQPVVFPGVGGIRVSALVQPYGDGLKLVLTQDITEPERTEAMRRNFVANVSHEIRTPLTVLAGFVETMSQLPLSEAERKRVLALMAAQAQRMQSLVADLLTLAKLEGSPRPPADRWTRVADLMKHAQADAGTLSEGRHALHFDGGGEAQIAGSEAELHSALGNLVVNAVRYTPPGGRIDVQWAVRDDGWGVLSVADTGIGIGREHLPRLTERFYRVDGSRSRDTGGTGLGLSIVKHVVQRHGGEIDIHSEPGRGSRFALLLPPSRVRQEPATAIDRAVPGPGPAANRPAR
ncbi:MAG: phosphate regulon sensor histidine kinase PhoR [Burkholderiaceae bacterium]|nr:phosphate regulon sensor histidine kinase PhoR [Burkholderiaceae bacterium]